MLQSPDMRNYQQAVRQLHLLPRKDAILLLETLAHSSDGELRARAVDAMTKVFPDQGEALASELLNDPEWFVRVSCIDNLSKLGNRSCIPQIVSILVTDPDDAVRCWAAFFLGVAADGSVVPTLQRCVETDKGSDHEGTPIAEIAEKAIAKIRVRNGLAN